MPNIELRVENEDVGAWMAINNAFTKTPGWNPLTHYWNGVLFQVGDYLSFTDGHPTTVFTEVSFRRADNSVVTFKSRDDFRAGLVWINIVAKRSGLAEPMQVTDLPRLHLVPPEHRSLHNYLLAFPGGITFWQHREKGYSMRSRQTASGNHNSFTFRLKGPEGFWVKIYSGPNFVGLTEEDLSAEGIALIRLRAVGGPSHAGHENPPQRP